MDWSILSNIPSMIAGAIAKLRGLFPENIYFIIAGVIAFVASYYYIKQFVVSGWGKLSTILNLILMALLIFLLLTRVS